MSKLISNRWPIALAMAFFAFSCEDEDPPKPAIASFQFEQDANDFRVVRFENFSENAVSYSWNFGDNSAASTEENPTHTFPAAGTYKVVLSAKGGGGDISTKEEEVIVNDPNFELKKLTGQTSKTWKMIRDVSTRQYPLQVGPSDRSTIWFAFGKDQPLGARPCLLNDEFIFKFNGDYQYKSNGDFWAEGGVWATEGCQSSTVPANYTNKDGVNVSAWGDGNHKFTYNVTEKKITVTGLGAYVAMTKAATTAEVTVPQSAVTYKLVKLVDAAVDTLILETSIQSGAGYWRFVLVSYDNPLSEPAMPSPPPPPGSINEVNFDFEATAGSPSFTVFGGTDFNGAGVTATKVANPQKSGINTSNSVMKVDQVVGVQGWSGMSTDLSGLVDFTGKQTFKVKVYSPAVGAVVKFKLEEIGNPGNNKEIDKTTTVANGWEELSFTFDAADKNKWNRLVLFFDFKSDVKTAATSFLFDDVKLQ